MWVGKGGGEESTHVKSPSWGPANWTGVPGLLEVKGRSLTCLLCEQWAGTGGGPWEFVDLTPWGMGWDSTKQAEVYPANLQ